MKSNTESDDTSSLLRALYGYVESREGSDSVFKSSIISSYRKQASKAKYFKYIFPLTRFVLPAPRGCIYFFLGCKYSEIILGLPRREVCVIGGFSALKFCLKHGVSFLPIMIIWDELARGLSKKDLLHDEKKILNNIYTMGKVLKKKGTEGSCLIVANDSLPLERVYIHSARLAGLECICIQHGIFQKKSLGKVFDGWFSDKFLVMNGYQRDLLVEKGMDSYKIKVMGPYRTSYRPKRLISPAGKRKVCFLGQPWVKYGSEKGGRYLELVKQVLNVFNDSGVKIVYKPHPWENGLKYLDRLKCIKYLSMEDALENYDVFISFTSTALIEADLSGRVSIQIKDRLFDADDFSVYGQINVVSTNNHNWPNEVLSKINKSPPSYKYDAPPGARFCKALGK